MLTYDLVCATDLEQLIKQVNECAANGWYPLGSPFVWVYRIDPLVCQAVTKPSDPKSPKTMNPS